MYPEYESNSEGDYRTAIAAAAFAVKSFEDQTRKKDQGIQNQGPEDSWTTNMTQPHYRTQPRPRSNDLMKPTQDVDERIAQTSTEAKEKPQEKTSAFIPSLRKKLSFGATTIISQPEQALLPSEEPIGTIPSIKNPITLKREEFNRKQETSKPKMDTPPHKQPPPLTMDTPPRKQPPPLTTNAGTKISKNVRVGETDADEWEKAEMSRIKEKYDRLSATILDWESKKKIKAKSQLDKVQAEPGKRRAKAVQRYRNELESIQKIVDGARSQAIGNQRNEELKVKVKANKLRLTGQLPSTCLCC